MDALTKKLERMDTKAMNVTVHCEIWEGGHVSIDYGIKPVPKRVEHRTNELGNYNQRGQGNLYSNTYNLGWRNHPNFSWNNQPIQSNAS